MHKNERNTIYMYHECCTYITNTYQKYTYNIHTTDSKLQIYKMKSKNDWTLPVHGNLYNYLTK